MTSDNWIESAILWYMDNFGTLVSEDQYAERIAVCKGCEFFGKVSIPTAEGIQAVDGCTKCGCPASTKPRVKEYFNPTRMRKVTISCPEGLWAAVDSKF